LSSCTKVDSKFLAPEPLPVEQAVPASAIGPTPAVPVVSVPVNAPVVNAYVWNKAQKGLPPKPPQPQVTSPVTSHQQVREPPPPGRGGGEGGEGEGMEEEYRYSNGGPVASEREHMAQVPLHQRLPVFLFSFSLLLFLFLKHTEQVLLHRGPCMPVCFFFFYVFPCVFFSPHLLKHVVQ
jgi:hypothetical protein